MPRNKRKSLALYRYSIFGLMTMTLSAGWTVDTFRDEFYAETQVQAREVAPAPTQLPSTNQLAGQTAQAVATSSAGEVVEVRKAEAASPTEKQEVLQYIVEVFGDDADKAIWMARCESGLRKDAINTKNRNGSVDYGVFQINSVHIKRHGDEFTKDWRENVRVAKKIYDEQGFRPWVCAKAIGEKNYLGQ